MSKILALALTSLFLAPGSILAVGPPLAKHWQTSYNRAVPGLGKAEGWALAVIQNSFGGYVAAGFTETECPATGALERSSHLIHVHAHGNLFWETPVDFGLPCAYGFFQDVIEAEDSYAAVGIQKITPQPFLSPNRIAFARVDKRTGEVLVQRVLHISLNFQSVMEQSSARGVRENPETGELVVGSESLSPGTSDGFLLRLDKSGIVLDHTAYDADPAGDSLKVQHHGASANVTSDFARRVTANHYLFCGNGAHHNPELEVVKAFAEARLKELEGGTAEADRSTSTSPPVQPPRISRIPAASTCRPSPSSATSFPTETA